MGFFSEILGNAGSVDLQKLSTDYGQLLTEGESIDAGFILIRDTFVFTNKRLILIEIQGVTGTQLQICQFHTAKLQNTA